MWLRDLHTKQMQRFNTQEDWIVSQRISFLEFLGSKLYIQKEAKNKIQNTRDTFAKNKLFS